MAPPAKQHSDARRFLAFLAGIATLGFAAFVAFVVFLIVLFSSSSEMGNDDRLSTFWALVVLAIAAAVCAGIVAGGVALITWALRGRWPARSEAWRWTALVVIGAFVFGIAPFFVG